MAFKYDDKDIKFTKHFIDGDFRDSKIGKYYELYDLLKDKPWIKVTEGDKTDVDYAVTAARHAYDYDSQWRTMDYTTRGRLFYRLADLLERDFDYLIWLESRTTGKTYDDTKFDLRRCIDYLRYYAGYTDKYYTKTDRSKTDYFEFTTYEPIGVIGLVGDHIDPLWTFIRQIIPVLATGNTLVYKPSYKTPLTILYVTKLTDEVGFPKGVINVVLGKGTTVGEAMGLHNYIKHITFTGRRDIGKLFYDYASRSNFKTLKNYFVEQTPLFVFNDADIDEAALIAHHAAFFKDGRTRYRPVRVFVHDDVYDRFVKRSVELVRKRQLGDFFDKTARVGSFIDETYFKNFIDYVENAKKEAKLEYGGKRYGTTTWTVEPTIFSDVRDDHKFLTNYDTYGPIKLITRFKKIEEIPDYLDKMYFNRTIGVVTTDFKRFKELEHRLDNTLFFYNTWYDLKPYFKYVQHKQTTFGDYVDQDFFDRDVLEYYLKKKVIDGLFNTKKYDYYTY